MVAKYHSSKSKFCKCIYMIYYSVEKLYFYHIFATVNAWEVHHRVLHLDRPYFKECSIGLISHT